MPQVSVIIPSHNSGAFLDRSVRSVLAQTAVDLEILVVDDGSERPRPDIVELDDRIRFLRQAKSGVSVARNLGVAEARGELVAFLDHDDEWMPTKLERQLEAVREHPDAVFWCSGFIWVGPVGETPSGLDAPTYRGMLSTQTVLLSSTMMRRGTYWRVGGSNPMLPQAEDWDLVLRLLAQGDEPHLVPEHLVKYHLHSSNTSRDYQRAAAERLAILDLHDRHALQRDDAATRRAVDAGRIRTHELFAHQAVDAARAAEHVKDKASHLLFAGRMDPRILVRAIVKTARKRLGRIRGH